ncbi:MAG: non-ribosomal peptide synthetase [Bryobacterales bacterium]|nr:non-ribosomal peptide synthetase [Bryobacterales bacterium]
MERILSIGGILRQRASLNPEAIALLPDGRPALNYAGLFTQVRSIAGGLGERGVALGDRVAIVLPDGSDMALAFLGVAATASAAPLNPAYRASEFQFYLSDLRAKALIAPEGQHACREAAEALRLPVWTLGELRCGDCSSEAIAPPGAEALVLHTSGTTSRPKLVPLSHGNLCHSAYNVGSSLALAPRDRCLNVMPLFHIHGLVAALLSSLSAGSSVVTVAGFDASRFLGWLEEFSPTWYSAVPTMHQALLGVLRQQDRGSLASSLRLIRSSSAALPPAVMAELESRFGVPVVEAYGMTEAAHQMASNPLPPKTRKPGSVGLAAGPEVAVLDEGGSLLGSGEEGEVAIRGMNVTGGYESNAAANAQAFTNGWFRTGDLGYLDPEGYLFLTGRLKEIINRGGEKIAPKEIDNCLMQHPAVAQAVAFAVPHTSLGQDVAAAVVLHVGAVASPAELQRFAAASLASFKVPNRILIVDGIPKGPTGKLQRIGLAEQLGLFDKEGHALTSVAPYVAPRNAAEERLAAIWAGVLNVERVGIHDDFSQSGGDSLLAAALLTQVSAAFEVGPETLVCDGVSTVEAMAEALAAGATVCLPRRAGNSIESGVDSEPIV